MILMELIRQSLVKKTSSTQHLIDMIPKKGVPKDQTEYLAQMQQWNPLALFIIKELGTILDHSTWQLT
jgi:hypothetical protein